MEVVQLHLLTGWLAILMSFLSGAVIGLYFHRQGWAGGYGSFSRRMLRLAHISFFGLGTINLLFGLTVSSLDLNFPAIRLTSTAFIIAVVTMPLCCYLAAWKRPLRVLFPIPVAASLAGIIPLLAVLTGQ
jgi:hypothetical protein